MSLMQATMTLANIQFTRSDDQDGPLYLEGCKELREAVARNRAPRLEPLAPRPAAPG